MNFEAYYFWTLLLIVHNFIFSTEETLYVFWSLSFSTWLVIFYKFILSTEKILYEQI